MRRLLTACSMALLLSACGGAAASPASSPASGAATSSTAAIGQPSTPARAASAPPASASASARASAAPAPATQAAQIFFTAGGKLVPESAKVSGPSPAHDAVELLLKGPQDAAHFSDIPKSTRLLDLSVKDGTATASFDSSFFSSGGSAGTQLRLAQVVYTLTQFPSITSVQLLENGKPATVAGGEGFPVNRPLTRKSFPGL